VAAKGFCLHF